MFSTEPQPFHTFAQSGDYIVTLTAYDKHKACPDTYTLPYSIASTCASLFIPDAFSPNGDGLNDVFAFVGNPAAFEATIYDRWGKIITQFSAIQDTWDGKNAPEGVYTYKLKLICENGKALSRAGTITLLR
jgi:gliding motility-associated-like protein